MTEEINVIYYDDNGNVLHLNQLDRPINDHSNINVYNNTEVDDRQYIGISIIFNLLVCGLFISFVKSVYDKIMICQNNNNRRIIRQNLLENNYEHIKIILKEDFENDICSICLDDLYDEGNDDLYDEDNDDLEENKSRDIIKLKCNHMYHKECIDPWIKINKNCPLCKRIIM